jgi:DNA polymerase III subunit gamma/tau
MSYVVLARKHRPKNFAQMVGQGHVVQALTHALGSGRLHHAYLFTGTRGVGKTTVSRILAKSLNCTGPDGQGGITATPCGVCDACRDIDSGRFVDYTELDAASNRGVDEVQTLLEQAVYKPVQGRFKVFMIDEVHMLTHPAFNAMLKTLEEPPEYLKFVLATTDPQKVPVTVLSRCLQFNLRAMAPDTIRAHLEQVLVSEGIEAEASALHLLARAARGSMRDALSLTDQAIAFGGGRLHEAVVRQMLGVVDRDPVWRILDAVAEGNGAVLVETVEALRQHGHAAASALDELIEALQRIAVWQAVPGAVLNGSNPEEAQVARLAERLPPDLTQLFYSLCLHGKAELGWAPDEYAALTMVLLRPLAFALGAPAARPPQAAAPLPAPTPAPQPAVASSVSPPVPPLAGHTTVEAEKKSLNPPSPESSVAPMAPLAPEALADVWFDCVRQLLDQEAVTALARELALQSQLVAQAPDGWTLEVANPSLNQPNGRARLEAALAQQGWPVTLRVQTGPAPDTPARRLAQAAQARLQAAEAGLLADPFVQAMMRDFGGKIVPGSLRAL